jgi:hypothetical protein
VQPPGTDAAEACADVEACWDVEVWAGVEACGDVGTWDDVEGEAADVRDTECDELVDPPEPHAATEVAVSTVSVGPAQRERNVPMPPRLVACTDPARPIGRREP